jgi:hypothetical protein
MSKEAMKLALEAMKRASHNIKESIKYYGTDGHLRDALDDLDYEEIPALEEALAKQEHGEPVAWMCHPFGDDECEFSDHQECENCIPLYTTPQQRTAAEGEDTRKAWVGLTDDEVIQIRDDMTLDIRSHVDFYRHCEAKLKAKNERKEKNT